MSEKNNLNTRITMAEDVRCSMCPETTRCWVVVMADDPDDTTRSALTRRTMTASVCASCLVAVKARHLGELLRAASGVWDVSIPTQLLGEAKPSDYIMVTELAAERLKAAAAPLNQERVEAMHAKAREEGNANLVTLCRVWLDPSTPEACEWAAERLRRFIRTGKAEL